LRSVFLRGRVSVDVRRGVCQVAEVVFIVIADIKYGTRTWLSLKVVVGNTREGGWCVYAAVELVWGRKFWILGALARWGC